MKPLRIRQWMLIGMLIILILPRLCYEIPSLWAHHALDPSALAKQQSAMNAMVLKISDTDIAAWHDPNWQSKVSAEVSSSHIGFILYDASDQEIIHAVPNGSEATSSREVSIVEGGRLLGKASFYMPKQTSIWGTVLAIIAGLFAILFIGWQMGRVVVKPLESMSAAARRIAGGDLEFQLPRSTVMEVADVRDAFQAMGKGLQESLIRQAELEEERRFFISSIAHDLRTPLFALRGFLVRLERGLVSQPEKALRYAAICSKKAEHLERLVSDLFAYSQLTSLNLIQRFEPLAVDALFDDIVAEYRPAAKERAINMVCDASAKGAIVHGDAHMLHRAIGNLVDNALRYTQCNGTISVSLYVEEAQVHFTIEDTGPGIPKDILPHIFEAFYRGEESRNPAYGGTGLGLTIAQRILSAHHGELTARNRSQAGGAIFSGWIPRSVHTLPNGKD